MTLPEFIMAFLVHLQKSVGELLRVVATINFLIEAGHATVGDLDRVPVEDLVKHVIIRELFIEDLEKHSPNICSHVLAKWWIVTNDTSLAVFSGGARRLS